MTKTEVRFYSSLVICVAGGLFIIYLSTIVHKYLVLALIPFAWIVSHQAMNISCPSCKTPVGGRMRNYIGLTAEELKRPRCLRCGYSFEGKSKKENPGEAGTE